MKYSMSWGVSAPTKERTHEHQFETSETCSGHPYPSFFQSVRDALGVMCSAVL